MEGKEEFPGIMPEPRGHGFIMRAKVDADHASDTVSRRSRTGLLIYLNCALVYWWSKKQTSVESSSFGSEFVAMKQCCEYIRGLSLSSSSSSYTSLSHSITSQSCTASINQMPDSDTDSVAHTMEGSGLFDPTVLATKPKKRKAKRNMKSHKRRKSFTNTGSDTSSNHSESDPPVEEASIQPVLTEEPDNDTNKTTEHVVVAIPVVTQTTSQKKGSSGHSLLTLICPTSL